MKAFVSSVIISGGLYFGYQLKLGPYSGTGDIVEAKIPAKRFHYYEFDQSYYKSEVEISRFINELMNKNIFGTFHKIQVNDPSAEGGSNHYLIELKSNKQTIMNLSLVNKFKLGVEETMDNMHKLKQYQETLKIKDIPSYSAVESHLNYDKKSSLFIALQMTFNVQAAIQKYVTENKEKFEGINPELYSKAITIGSNKKLLQTSISYPFGKGSEIFQEFLKPSTPQPPQTPNQEQQTATKPNDEQKKTQ